MLNLPWLAANPASGRITSLGSGGNRFSKAMAAPAPTAPMESMRSAAQPATPPVGASFAAMVVRYVAAYTESSYAESRIMPLTLRNPWCAAVCGRPQTLPAVDRSRTVWFSAVRAAPPLG